jgi:hypothetical protein
MGDPPVIVTCHINHALDQLFRHVVQSNIYFINFLVLLTVLMLLLIRIDDIILHWAPGPWE